MRSLQVLVLVGVLGSVAALGAMACGEDDAIVRERNDSGSEASVSDGSRPETLGCGIAIPTRYESPAFETNAAIEVAFAHHFEAIVAKMEGAEEASTSAVTAAELKAIYSEGAPSLRAVSSASTSSIVDGYFDDFGAAIGKTWTPADAEQDGGALTGGKFTVASQPTLYFSPIGIHLREGVEKALLGGLYNHVLGLVAAPITDPVIDRLLAAFGASPALLNRTNGDAGLEEDVLIAEYAAKRDDPSSATPGPYRKIKTALLTMKAAVPAGDRCKADLDAAVATFLLEWERATYATAIYYLNSAALSAADPGKGPQSLHSYSEAFGFIQSFKGLPTDKRKITDSQIDALLTKIGASTAFKLVTNPGDRSLKLNDAISDIALYEGFTAPEVEAFRKTF